jgi:hypothetical protein
MGNTGDPVTAYQDSVAMAHDLARARLLTVDGFGHTEFFNPSTCASDYEFRYLITGALPRAARSARRPPSRSQRAKTRMPGPGRPVAARAWRLACSRPALAVGVHLGSGERCTTEGG